MTLGDPSGHRTIGDGSLSSNCSDEDSPKDLTIFQRSLHIISARKRSIQERNLSSYKLQGFFCKEASSHVPSIIVVNDEEISQQVTKQ